MSKSLDQWLTELEQRGPAPIKLGLDRVHAVHQRLTGQRDGSWRPPLVFVVAGTNGKGSTVAYLDQILRTAGLRCGRYTSPHLLDYAERIAIDGRNASSTAIVAAFERIDAARGEIELTYFEFATLAALEIFADAGLDAWVLEVGLGGRLDAVNIVDADVAVITSVDLDHQQYLGNEREAIGREKAGIMRAGRPVVVGDPAPPRSVIEAAAQLAAPRYGLGQQFSIHRLSDSADTLLWNGPDGEQHPIPQPPLAGAHQQRNLATALAALWCARERWPWSDQALRDGIKKTVLPGRLQPIPAPCACYLDVAHNPDGARALAAWLSAQRQPGRQIWAVFGLLADKDLDGVLQPLQPCVDRWAVATLEGARGRPAEQLAAALRAAGHTRISTHASVVGALEETLAAAAQTDLVIAFGSFHVAEQVLRWAASNAFPQPSVLSPQP